MPDPESTVVRLTDLTLRPQNIHSGGEDRGAKSVQRTFRAAHAVWEEVRAGYGTVDNSASLGPLVCFASQCHPSFALSWPRGLKHLSQDMKDGSTQACFRDAPCTKALERSWSAGRGQVNISQACFPQPISSFGPLKSDLWFGGSASCTEVDIWGTSRGERY